MTTAPTPRPAVPIIGDQALYDGEVVDILDARNGEFGWCARIAWPRGLEQWVDAHRLVDPPRGGTSTLDEPGTAR